MKNFWIGEDASIRQILRYRKAAGYTMREDLDRIWRRTIVWYVLKCIPRGVKEYVIIEAAVRNEQGNPCEVTAVTMLKRLR